MPFKRCNYNPIRHALPLPGSRGFAPDVSLLLTVACIFDCNLKLTMSERILAELGNIKQGDRDLQTHIRQFVSNLLLDRAPLSHFEAYSAQQRISNGTQESVFKVREAYSHLKDFETKNRALLAVRPPSRRNSTQAHRKSPRSRPPSATSPTSRKRDDCSRSSELASGRRKATASSSPCRSSR